MPSESALVRVIDAKTGAALAAVSGVDVSRADGVFTFRADQVGGLVDHLDPAKQFIEITTYNGKGRPERWRAGEAKSVTDEAVAFDVTTLDKKKV